jgi:hypothetical protein
MPVNSQGQPPSIHHAPDPLNRACRRIRLEVIEASDSSLPLSFSLRFDSDSVPGSNFLLGQFHQVPHEFVQIE